jgi:bifunctional DNase/RNase
MSEMIEVTIDNIRVSLMSPQRLVILRESGGQRFLPIWVGPYEAEAITVALNEIEIVRPLTHDLIRNLFSIFEAQIKRIEINALREDIFYANIVFEANGQSYNLDSRPSDAIAIAVRARVPILVNTDVMDEAGVTPEADLNTQSKPSSQDDVTNISQRRSEKTETKPAEVDQDDLGRLSIFEDFLSKLDKPDANEGDKPKP